jgi:hypothetical protein
MLENIAGKWLTVWGWKTNSTQFHCNRNIGLTEVYRTSVRTVTNSAQPVTELWAARRFVPRFALQSMQKMNGKRPNVESDASLKTRNLEEKKKRDGSSEELNS